MALNYSFPGPSGLADSTAIRKDLAGLVVRDSSGVVRGGVFPRHTGALITARSDMRVNVLPFEGVTSRGGPSFIANDGSMVSPLLDYAPSSNARIDVVYFKQNESSLADADNLPIIGVVTGTASADPQKPALTIAGAEELGTVYVPSTAVATNSSGVVVMPTHRFTAAAGGVVLLRNAAEQDAFTPASGQAAFRLDAERMDVFSGTWQMLGGKLPFFLAGRDKVPVIASGVDTVLESSFTWTSAPTNRGFTYANGILTFLTAGVYDVAAAFSFAAAASGARRLFVLRNGSSAAANPILYDEAAGSSAALGLVSVAGAFMFAAGDTLRVSVWQNSGAALAAHNGSGAQNSAASFFSVTARGA